MIVINVNKNNKCSLFLHKLNEGMYDLCTLKKTGDFCP